MVRLHVQALPVVLFSFLAVTAVTCYLLCVFQHHCPAFFPTLSETGDFPPESGVFTVGLVGTGFGLILISTTMWERMREVFAMSEKRLSRPRLYKFLNHLFLFTGLLWALCMCLVGAFQSRLVPAVHYPAAITLFFSATVNIIIVTIVLHSLRDFFPTQCGSTWRLIIMVFSACAFLSILIVGGLYRWHHLQFEWVALNEWILAFSFGVYWCAHVKDLAQLSVELKVQDPDALRRVQYGVNFDHDPTERLHISTL